jgi:ribosomal protein S7
VSAQAAIIQALEAIEAGNQREAVDILLAALEDSGPRVTRARCECGYEAEWPGLLWQHRCPMERAA